MRILIANKYQYRGLFARATIERCSGISILSIKLGDQIGSSLDSQIEPFCQIWLLTNLWKNYPLDKASAELSGDGTCLHFPYSVFPWICETRFATNVFSLCDEVWILWSTIVESDQKKTLSKSVMSDLMVVSYNFSGRTAAHNSSRSKDNLFIGVTVFKQIKPYWSLKYL